MPEVSGNPLADFLSGLGGGFSGGSDFRRGQNDRALRDQELARRRQMEGRRMELDEALLEQEHGLRYVEPGSIEGGRLVDRVQGLRSGVGAALSGAAGPLGVSTDVGADFQPREQIEFSEGGYRKVGPSADERALERAEALRRSVGEQLGGLFGVEPGQAGALYQADLLDDYLDQQARLQPFDPATDPDMVRERAMRTEKLGRYAPPQRTQPDTIPYNADTDEVILRAEAMRDRGLSGSTSRPPTEVQTRIRVTLPRAEEAVDRLEEFINERGGVPTTTWLDRVTPGAYAQPSDVQVYNQAARAAASAILRIESGAATTESEERRYMQQFIPMPGDKPEVIQQKLRAIRVTLQSMRQMAGGDAFGGEQSENPASIHAAGMAQSTNDPADLWEQLVAEGMAPDRATAEVRRQLGVQ